MEPVTSSKSLGMRYLFHLHTKYGDGELSIADYFQYAKEHHLRPLMFLEHVRRKPSYSVQKYAEEIRKLSEQTGIRAYVGFEMKLLPNSDLDISDWAYELCDVVGLAVHEFPNNFLKYMSAFSKAMQRYKNKTRVWVHPGIWFRRRHLLSEQALVYMTMLRLATGEGWLIEENRKYDLIPHRLRGLVHKSQRIVGVDSHHLSDLSNSNYYNNNLSLT